MRKDLIVLLEIFLKDQFLKKGDGNWIDILPTITKQHNDRIHSSNKLTPIQASLKKNEGIVYQNLLDKRKKSKLKFQIHDFLHTADFKRTFPKSDTSNWS